MRALLFGVSLLVLVGPAAAQVGRLPVDRAATLPELRTALGTPTEIRVEIDFMVDDGPTGDGHSHRPSRAEMDAVVQMFACQGITLTVVIDDAIPHRPTLFRDPDDSDNFFDFEDEFYPERTFLGIKNEHFDRGSGWHYAVFGHQYQDEDYGLTTSGGLGELPGDDFVVTLGARSDQVGTPFERASVFAHELGHNLGLYHTGATQLAGEHVMNLPSVMSYFYSYQGVRSSLQCLGLAGSSDEETLYKEMDYSQGRACSLSEFALDESRGMGIRPVDWNCDGTTGGTVIQNLNDSRSWCSTTGTLETLSDFDEWSAIIDVASLDENAYVSTTVTCATADEVAAFKAHLDAQAALRGFAGGCSQPTLTAESCTSRRMVYLRNSGSLPFGTCRSPARSLAEATPFMRNGNILYVQPGSYPTSGTVLDQPVQILGPGGAVFGDN